MTSDKSQQVSKQDFSAQIGELLQHGVNVDPKIIDTSNWYYQMIAAVLKRHPELTSRPSPRYLEIASYRHIIGYRLASEMGFNSTQFDLSSEDLEAGHQLAIEAGYGEAIERVSGDFHDLPFSDNYFDLVFISASIHHTRTPERVIGEAMRTLANGGFFYCQREPCLRLFSFYKFTCNRKDLYTPFEQHLEQRDMLRIFSSPFHGSRNAAVFGRIENDRMPLSFFYETFDKYGEVLEEVLYHEGLLTRLDKEILARVGMQETHLAEYIANQIRAEVLLAKPIMTERDRLLGYSLPCDDEIVAVAQKVAVALKTLPEDTTSKLWQRSMVEIFGGSLRFIVRRRRDESERNNNKFKRNVTPKGGVLIDDEVSRRSGLEIWKKLLPDLQTASEADLTSCFSEMHWTYMRHTNGTAQMISKKCAEHRIDLPVFQTSLIVMRYKIVLDEKLPAVRVLISMADAVLLDEVIPQPEDRCATFVHTPRGESLLIRLFDLDGQPVETGTRFRVSILQAVPVCVEV